MSEEKKPISKTSTVTISLVILLVSAAIFIGSTVQKVSANEEDIKTIMTKIDLLATKEDVKNLGINLIREFSK